MRVNALLAALCRHPEELCRCADMTFIDSDLVKYCRVRSPTECCRGAIRSHQSMVTFERHYAYSCGTNTPCYPPRPDLSRKDSVAERARPHPGRNDSVGDEARPHPGPLPRGEGGCYPVLPATHHLVCASAIVLYEPYTCRNNAAREDGRSPNCIVPAQSSRELVPIVRT